MFTEFSKHHHNLILGHFHHPKYYKEIETFLEIIEHELAEKAFLKSSLRINVLGIREAQDRPGLGLKSLAM